MFVRRLLTRSNTAKFALFAAALALFVLGWVALLAVLAQDSCLDMGGTLTGLSYACQFSDGRVLGWISLLPIRVLILSMGVVGAPLFVLYRLVIRWLFPEPGPGYGA